MLAANDRGEVEVTMLQYPEDSIGPAIERMLLYSSLSSGASGLGALKGFTCQIKKKEFVDPP